MWKKVKNTMKREKKKERKKWPEASSGVVVNFFSNEVDTLYLVNLNVSSKRNSNG